MNVNFENFKNSNMTPKTPKNPKIQKIQKVIDRGINKMFRKQAINRIEKY